MGWFSRFKQGPEGSYRGPAVGVAPSGAMFPIPFGDGFESGLDIYPTNSVARLNPTVYACIALIARAVSLCRPQYQEMKDGRWITIDTGPIADQLRYPNGVQQFDQLIYNSVAQMETYGESFVLLTIDSSGVVTTQSLLPPGTCSPYMAGSEVFYSIGEDPLDPASINYMVPARNIIHLRQVCPRNPLIGESPLKAAALAAGLNTALSHNQARFFAQMSRPSGVLSTDLTLTRAQIQELRKAFEDQAAGMNSGGIPILAGGLKFQQMSISSQDAQLVQAQDMSIADIARVYGVPLPLLGAEPGTASTETLVNHWLSTSLGSLIELVERTYERAFRLNIPTQRIQLDTDQLVRIDVKSRVEALTKGVQGGIFTPDEARAKESLPSVKGGDQVFLQRQMTPISLINDMAVAELAGLNEPPPNPAPLPAEQEPAPDTEKGLPVTIIKSAIRDMLRNARHAH
jgi:HK97 family phage portal protein